MRSTHESQEDIKCKRKYKYDQLMKVMRTLKYKRCLYYFLFKFYLSRKSRVRYDSVLVSQSFWFSFYFMGTGQVRRVERGSFFSSIFLVEKYSKRCWTAAVWPSESHKERVTCKERKEEEEETG
jgi:hypothetical protein